MSYRGRQLRQRDPKTGRLFRVIDPTPKLTSPPRALRKARLDNLTLVTGNLLPFKRQWQAIANDLPDGGVLIILPTLPSRPRSALEKVSQLLRAKGYPVTTLQGFQRNRRLKAGVM